MSAIHQTVDAGIRVLHFHAWSEVDVPVYSVDLLDIGFGEDRKNYSLLTIPGGMEGKAEIVAISLYN